MLKEREVTYGQLRIMIYDFEYKDDVLEEHSHNRENTHITICAKGEVSVVFNDKTINLKEGNIIEFFPGQTHAIKALTDNCRILNIPIHYVQR
jgi:quercetin dioxygenase-like cupin family protein